MLHQTRLSDILWWCVLRQWILTRSRKDPRHHRDDTPSNEAGTTVIFSSKLPADIHPHLSHHTEPLHALLKKENSFTWDENSNTIFQKIISLLQKALLKPLRYYNRNKPVTIQCDASLKGLRACIIQDGHPIAFVSKSLTNTETWYANIKRELLAIMYGCEKFHTYLYSRTFLVKQTTNHWRWSAWRILL